MSHAFVTGGTGFLGQNLIEELLKQNWAVTALHLPHEDLSQFNNKNIHFVEGDILYYSSIMNAIPNDKDLVIFHLAGDTTSWKKLAKRQYEINVLGTRNIVQVAQNKKVKRLVVTSSISAYGFHPDKMVDEQTTSNALSCHMNYNRTKYLAEQEVHRGIKLGLNALFLNPCNIMGPYDKKGWASLILSVSRKQAPATSKGVGTFAHVGDVAKAHIKAAEVGRSGENYLLGGCEISFAEIYQKIITLLESDLKLITLPNSLYRLIMYIIRIKAYLKGTEPILTYPKYIRLTNKIICDDSKAKEELGYSTASFDQMLSDSYHWLLSAGLIEEKTHA